MKRKGILRVTALFFALMICFTILSRAAYQEGTAVVETGKPSNMVISHQIKTTGKVVQNQELAVTTEPNLRVASIEVSQGERVSQGDLLFTLDLTMLEEKILDQQQEMEKQQLNVEDAKSQKDVSQQQKANEQAQAAENYSLNTNRAGVALSRAKRELQEAQKALKEFRKNSGQTQEDSSVEAALEEALQEKTQDYIDAQEELDSLEWKIENAVYTALQAAGGSGTASASLAGRQSVLTRSGDVLLEEDGAEVCQEAVTDHTAAALPETVQSAGTPSGNPSPQMEAGGDSLLEDTGTEITGNTGTAGGQDNFPPVLESPETQEVPETSGNSGGSAADTETQETFQDILLEEDPSNLTPDEPPSDDGGSGRAPGAGDGLLEGETGAETEKPQDTAATQEELDELEQSVRDSYQAQLDTAREKVETALAGKEAAQAALTQYQQERLAASSASNAQTEQTLIDNVQAAQDAYVDASIAANEAAVTSGRAVASAGIPNASNSSDRINEITYEQMELQLEKLEKLQEAEGKVFAPADGLVTGISIQTGGITTDTTAILLADLSKGYSFVGEITEDQEQYIGTGDLVTLTGSAGSQKYEDLPVSSVAADEENEGIYRITVQLPADTLEIGAAATLEFTKKSEAYSICVPLSALYLDEKNMPYVLVIDEVDSVMGTELRARKVTVTVLEQNESYAALAEGAISSQQEVIISSDKGVDDGSRVRLAS